MKRAVVISAVVIAAAFALTQLDFTDRPAVPESNPVIAPQPEPVVVAPIVVPPPVAKIGAAPIVDAGVESAAIRTIDVLFHVKEGKATAAGQRLALRKGTEAVDGLVDVMGHVTLPLSPGRWQIRSPERTFPYEIEVREETAEIEVLVLDSRDLVVNGVVLGADSKGVPGARVIATDGTLGFSTETDLEGRFRTGAPGVSELILFATDGALRSGRVRVVRPKDTVALRLEAATTLVVNVLGPGADTASIKGIDRSGPLECDGRPCTMRVLSGEVKISAATRVAGQLFLAHKVLTIETTETTEKHEVTLLLRPAPPVRGTLFGPNGALLPGVELELWSLPPRPELLASTITTNNGSFTVPWPGFADAASVRVGPLYALDREALVSAGDAPLLLSAHPVGADAQ